MDFLNFPCAFLFHINMCRFFTRKCTHTYYFCISLCATFVPLSLFLCTAIAFFLCLSVYIVGLSLYLSVCLWTALCTNRCLSLSTFVLPLVLWETLHTYVYMYIHVHVHLGTRQNQGCSQYVRESVWGCVWRI